MEGTSRFLRDKLTLGLLGEQKWKEPTEVIDIPHVYLFIAIQRHGWLNSEDQKLHGV